MRLILIVREYLRGNLIVVIKDNDKKFTYVKGSKIDKRFILNSFTEIIKLNI